MTAQEKTAIVLKCDKAKTKQNKPKHKKHTHKNKTENKQIHKTFKNSPCLLAQRGCYVEIPLICSFCTYRLWGRRDGQRAGDISVTAWQLSGPHLWGCVNSEKQVCSPERRARGTDSSKSLTCVCPTTRGKENARIFLKAKHNKTTHGI